VWGRTFLDANGVGGFRGCGGWETEAKEAEIDFKEVFYALDNFRDSSGVVAARIGQFVHTGRIHSHTARAGGRGSDHQPSEWPKYRGLIQRFDRALDLFDRRFSGQWLFSSY
jgi:hypothetical protein